MTELTIDRPYSTNEKIHTKIISSQNPVFINNLVGYIIQLNPYVLNTDK
jgi:hypothetical protein